MVAVADPTYGPLLGASLYGWGEGVNNRLSEVNSRRSEENGRQSDKQQTERGKQRPERGKQQIAGFTVAVADKYIGTSSVLHPKYGRGDKQQTERGK
jgi:hypothetical protein